MQGITLPFRVGISPTLKIRGLIASQPIPENTTIERCPAVIYPINDEAINKTVFEKYVFDWDENHEAMALGYGSLHNHSDKPNVGVDLDFENKEIVFFAKREIAEGEELTISYTDEDSGEPVNPHYLDYDEALKN